MTRIKPTDELATILTTLSLFHCAVQHADDKARTIVAIQTMLMATVAAQFAFLAAPSALFGVQLAILAIFIPGYVQSSIHLLRALHPQIVPVSMNNRFAFPSMATGLPLTQQPLLEQCMAAHEVSNLLARLAVVKHRHIQRAIYGTGVVALGAIGSLVLSAVS